jgi:hypothetical protein
VARTRLDAKNKFFYELLCGKSTPIFGYDIFYVKINFSFNTQFSSGIIKIDLGQIDT